jgi:hypothetical protein
MPIYKCNIKGDSKARIVRADTAAQARKHIVTVETMTAEQMADAIENGATVERAAKEEPQESDEGKTKA